MNDKSVSIQQANLFEMKDENQMSECLKWFLNY